MTEDAAWQALANMQAASEGVCMPSLPDWQEARSLQQRHSLSFWDALLVAACLRAFVETLFTEDMGAPRLIDGMSLVSPFVDA